MPLIDWINYEARNAQCNAEYASHPSAVGEVVEALLSLREDQPLHLVTTRFRMNRSEIRTLWHELETRPQ